jgi:exonuclease III
MLNFLFWNLNGQFVDKILSDLLRERQIDILILAEVPVNDGELLTKVNHDQQGVFEPAFNLETKIRTFVRFPRKMVAPICDAQGISIRHIEPPGRKTILVVGVHLPSKLYRSEAEQAIGTTRLRLMILDAEEKVGHSRTLVIGDLNMNPFELGVVSAGCFHAVMDRRIAQRESRVVDGEERKFFYNPMWGLMGDCSAGPPGTYYYGAGGEYTLFWNTFDQVLLRPALLECFSSKNLEIITEVEGVSLLTASGRPNAAVASDHLPIHLGLTI